MKLLAIADDLTGAAEIAGVGLRHGLSVQLVRHEPYTRGADTDLTVIDTDSRQCTGEEAAARVTRVMQYVESTSGVRVYKKIDSLLRGRVAAETTALLAATGCARALVVPQNPALGRAIRDGRYLVNGVPLPATAIGRTVEHPVQSAHVTQLLGHAAHAVWSRPAAQWPRAGLLVPDGATVADIEALAAALDETTLPCGGGAFFAAWLTCALGLPTPVEASEPPAASLHAPPLWVCGTASPAGRDTAQRLRREGVPLHAMPRRVFEGDDDAGALESWADGVMAALEHGPAAIIIGHEVVDDAGAASRLTAALATVVARVLRRCAVDVLCVEGGATAAAVSDSLAWRGFTVEHEVAPGVVRLRADEPRAPPMIVKPGSYAWPPHFFDLMSPSPRVLS